MLMKVYSVRDMKAEAFLQPFFCPTTGSALRAFGDACEKIDSPFFIHPQDYVLYEIGTYNDDDARLTSVSPVAMLACATDFASGNRSPKDFKALESNPREAISVDGKKSA